MGKLSHSIKLEIINLEKSGLRQATIVKVLSEKGNVVSRQQVAYWVNQHRFGYFDPSVSSESKQKKFRCVSVRDIEIVKKSLTLNAQQSSNDIHKELVKDGAEFCRNTTKQIIRAAGFTSAKPRYAQLVREPNKLKRVDFCRKLIDENDTQDDIIFTDESSIQLHHNKQTTYRLTDAPNPSLPKPKHPLKVHVWGGISSRGQTMCIIFDGIMEKEFFTNAILKETLLPFIEHRFPDGHRLQQDNDPKHRSKLAREYMKSAGIKHWEIWPSGKKKKL